MKRKLLSILCLSVFVFVTPVSAEETDINVEPNIYEGRKININRQFQDLIQKAPLPEEQKNLTFEKPVKTETNRIEEQLFLSTTQETNTITTKAEQFNLFSNEEKQTKRMTDEQQVEQSNTTILLFMIIVVSLVIGTMFFFIIPRLKQTHN